MMSPTRSLQVLPEPRAYLLSSTGDAAASREHQSNPPNFSGHHWRSDRDDMPSLSCIDSLPEGSVGLNEELASPNTKAKDLLFKYSSSDIPDDSLTSLKWLHEFSMHSASERQQVISTSRHESNLLEQQLGGEAPAPHLAGDLASVDMPLTPGKPTATAVSAMDTLPSLIAHGHCPDEVDYKTNPHIRPPYSYATLICMAIQASKKCKITLSSIYKWITDNFCYFHHANPTWQNSIRHSLSLNKCFRKVPRQKDEPGKGGFWTIDPEYAERLLTGAYKMQRMPPVQINSVFKNQLRMNSQPVMTVPANATGVFQLNPESQQLLKESEKVTGLDQNWDTRLAETTSFDCRSAVKGQKRKQPYSHRAGSAKVLCRSTSPLLSMEEPKVLPSNFDWDALLNSVLYGDLSLNEVVPLSPVPDDQDLVDHGINVSSIITTLSTAESSMLIETQKENNVDFEEETFLATEFLESPWKVEEDWNPPDFLCTSTADINQLFDLGDLLSDDPDSKLQRLSSLISSSVSLDNV